MLRDMIPGYKRFRALTTCQTMWCHKPEDYNVKIVPLWKLKIVYKVCCHAFCISCCHVACEMAWLL